jgi:sulfatase modifying factor 1
MSKLAIMTYSRAALFWLLATTILLGLGSCAEDARTSEAVPDEVVKDTVAVFQSNFIGIKLMVGIKAVGGNFFMDETPVTYSDLQRYVDAGGEKNAYWEYDSYNIPAQPVSGISWHMAADYCNWRSKVERFKPAYVATNDYDFWGYPIVQLDATANGYRLPSSVQFEAGAAGGLSHPTYPWGEIFHDSLANFDTDRGHKSSAWWRLALVKSQYQNDLGLYGMAGNVWEWCDDWEDDQLHVKSIRGGSWGSLNQEELKIGAKAHSMPGNYNYDIGFRCILPMGKSSLDSASITPDYAVKHTFYSAPELNPNRPSFSEDKLESQLARYLGDNYPTSICFQQKVDEQETLTPEELAQTIVSVCRKNGIHPLFLTAIMISESGMGTVSFPRWFNSPMAFHWQNKLMAEGAPVYEDRPGIKNRKYKTLEDGFDAFCKGIKRDLYYNAARTDLYAFHKIYVGYEALEWMHTLSRVYRDIMNIRFEPDYPNADAGQYIYLNWEELK